MPGHSWQTYMVVLPDGCDRSTIIATLRDAGIEANLGAQSVMAQPYYQERYGVPVEGWNSYRLFKQGLALPFHESITPEQMRTIGDALATALPGRVK